MRLSMFFPLKLLKRSFCLGFLFFFVWSYPLEIVMLAEENAVITRPVQRGELQLTAPEKATVAREPSEGQPAVPKEGIWATPKRDHVC